MAIDRRPTQQDLSWFLDLHKQNKLNLSPAYQRRSVWGIKDKRFFLDTIFNNYPCPAIYIQKETDDEYNTTYNVVDGKQRLMTIIDFYHNKIKLSDSLHNQDLNNKKWSEILDREIKKKFLNYSFNVETLDSLDDSGWNNVFDRLNRNSKTLSHQELRHARFDGWLVNRAEHEATLPFWKEIKISSSAKARRMKDVEFISIFMLIILEDKIVGFPQSALDILYEKYEIESSKDENIDEDTFFSERSFDSMNQNMSDQNLSQQQFNKQVESYIVPQGDIEEFDIKLLAVKNFISSLNAESDILTANKVFGAKRTTHLYTLWTYLSLVEIPSDISEFKGKYEDFFNIFEQLKNTDEAEWTALSIDQTKREKVSAYYTNAMGPTTEEPQRKARLEALDNFLNL